ncbi:unnamed protein product [Pleuronectes platessa]|uniref:Uncharacterized protein n=1 Tax=Pleuronectes platessa TaxID=8262 RepID=A0A9N7YYR6_PLEPL|nr:unnamed protein product [Pleuronectes platessa]
MKLEALDCGPEDWICMSPHSPLAATSPLPAELTQPAPLVASPLPASPFRGSPLPGSRHPSLLLFHSYRGIQATGSCFCTTGSCVLRAPGRKVVRVLVGGKTLRWYHTAWHGSAQEAPSLLSARQSTRS